MKGGRRPEGTFTITAEVPQNNWRISKTVKRLKSYIDGTISVPNMGRMPFFAISNGDISGMMLYMPAMTTADVIIDYPNHGSNHYFSYRVNYNFSCIFWGDGPYCSIGVGGQGSELEAEVNYNNPPYPQMKYRFRARGSNSTYFVGLTRDLIVIPEQNGDMGIFNKSQLDNDFLTSDLRYEINLISNANKELNGVLKATSKNDNKIDISSLKPARYNLTLYKGNKVVFSESFEKR